MVGPDDDSRPRVFLSYVRDEPSDRVRERLIKALGDNGLEAWMGVPPGEQPGPARDRYLAGAQAAVAIVSPRTLETEWMRDEAEQLRRRAADDAAFVLVVVMAGEVSATAMGGWHRASTPRTFVVAADGDAEDRVAQVLALLASVRALARVGAATPAGGRALTAARHANGVMAIAFATLDGRPCVVTGDGTGTLRVIDLAGDELRIELPRLDAGFISAIVVGVLDGVPVAVAGGYTGTLHVVDLVDAKVVGVSHLQQSPVGGLALVTTSTGGLLVVRGCDDGTIRTWNPRDGDRLSPLTSSAHTGPVRSVAVAHLGDRAIAVSGGDDRRVGFWDLATGVPIHDRGRGHTGAVRALAAGVRQGRPVVVSGGEEGTLRLWELADGRPLGEPLQAHAGGVIALATITAGGRSLAVSAGADELVRVWDLERATAVGEPLLGHVEPGGAIATGPLAGVPVGAIATGLLAGVPVAGFGDRLVALRLWNLPSVDGAPVTTNGASSIAHNGSADDRVEWVSDARADVDLLQRKPLAHALATRLRRLRVDDPGRSFLIHIDGRWGSGKSTLLELLRKDLSTEWLVVDFDAWRQMRVGPPWWALLASLRHAVRADMGPVAATRLRMAESVQRMRRGGALYFVAVAAVLAIGLAVALLLGAGLDIGAADKLVSSIVAVTAGIGALYAAMSAVGRFLLWDSAAGARVFEQSHRDPMESVADHFAWLIARAGRPVVFFVDDLDRCANEYVVELLDAVQTLIRDAPGRIDDRALGERACYVIVAADGRWIRTSYEHAHAEFAEAVEEPGRPLGYLFLDKIFQLTVPVPSISPQRQAAYLHALLRLKEDDGREERLEVQVRDVEQRVDASTSEAEALQAYDEAPAEVRAQVIETVVGKLAEPEIQEGTQHRLERFSVLIETNPRAMKLVLNAYGIARALQVIEDNVVPGDVLALWTILRVRWPALADYLRANPDAIDALVEGRAPDDGPPELARLFTAPPVRRIVMCSDGGPLSAAQIRACCGIAEDAAATAPLPAGTP